MWAKFDCGAFGGADAYATKNLTLPGEFWLQADVYIPSSTLTACADHDLHGFSAELVTAGIFDSTRIEAFDVSYPSGNWKWDTDCATSTTPVAGDTTYTLKVHIVGANPTGSPAATISWYVDGVLVVSCSHSITNDGLSIGGVLSEQCSCEWYFVTNVKVGTTDGGVDIFADDFSSGDFSNWTTTTGACSVVAAPSDCAAASISPSPNQGCFGTTVTVTGADFAPDSPLTVTFDGRPVAFSEATSDGSGNVSGTFTIPLAGFSAPGDYVLEISDGDGNTADATIHVCCNHASDYVASTDAFGPDWPLDAGVSDVDPLDYVHHDGAHWAVAANTASDGTIFTTFPPPDFKPLTVFRVPDDGSSASGFDVDTDVCWQFDLGGDGGDLISGGDNGTFIAKSVFEFVSWSKPILDARLASDGTNLWLAVLTEATVPYPYITSDDDQPGSGTAQPSQTAQFVTLSTLTSAFTTFYTGGPGAPANYSRLHRLAYGAVNIFSDNPPGSDGGDSWTGYWTIPRLSVYSLAVGAATHLGDIDALYYPGDTAATDLVAGAGSVLGAPTLYNKGRLSRLLSGLSVCASPAEAGVFHVVFAEGGAYGRCGASGGSGPFNTWAVWDGNTADVNYRISHSRWDAGGMIDETDLSASHIDRSNWFFTYDDGLGAAPYGYTWPATADLAWSQIFQVRNDGGTPLLFLSDAETTPNKTPPNGDPDPHGNPWLDNVPWYGEPTVRLYDLSGGPPVLLQTLGSGLLPTLAEITSVDLGGSAPNALDAPWDEGFDAVAGLAVSGLYPDPTLAGQVVFEVGVPWTALDAATASILGPPCTGFYRVAADGSATFDVLDGVRSVGYSILVAAGFETYFDPSSGRSQRLVAEPRNLWSAAQGGPWQLERSCLMAWTSYLSLGVSLLGFYSDGDHFLYGVDPSSLVRSDVCRGCRSCYCPATGLRIWTYI